MTRPDPSTTRKVRAARWILAGLLCAGLSCRGAGAPPPSDTDGNAAPSAGAPEGGDDGETRTIDPIAAAAAEPSAETAAASRPEVPLPPGEVALGVRRLPPLPIREGMDHDAPAVTVTGDGRVVVAVVSRAADDTETIFVREADGPRAALGAPRAASSGARAWNPALASGPEGAVWLTWCGRETAPGRDDHRRAVYLMRLGAGGGPIVVADGPGRQCDPALAVAEDGEVHVAWEAEDRIAWRAFGADGTPRGDPATLSKGPLDRRPALLARDGAVFIAWDVFADPAPTGAVEPRYDVMLRIRSADGRWGEAVPVDAGPGLAAAPALAPAPGGGALVAYHTSDRHPLVKWWRLRHVSADGTVTGLAHADAAGDGVPEGEQQGAELPDVAVGPDGRVAIVTRPSHGAYLHLVDATGVTPPLDLTRRGWGARGPRARAAFGPDGTLLVVRRARHEAILERFVFEAPGAGPPPFVPIGEAADRDPPSGLATDAGPPRARPVDPAVLGAAHDGQQIVFGDVHMHSALSDGTGPADEAYARARVRGLDFAVLTDHDTIVGSRMFPSKYSEIAWLTDWFDRLDGFTTLHAFEWTTPVVPRGSGHRNVYFRGHARTPIPGARDGYPDTPALNRALAEEQAFTAPHHAAWTGTDWENFDPDIQRHFEIVSVHGAFEMQAMDGVPIPPRGEREEGFAVHGLAEGHVFGFLGGSDAHGLLWHHGLARRPDPWDQGLTGVAVPALERGALWDAMHARRTFATSGARMTLQVSVGDVPMGAEGEVRGAPEVRWTVEATADLRYLMVLRDGVPVHRRALEGRRDSGSWQDEDVTGGRHVWYVRVVQGEGAAGVDVAWSSPVFLNVTR